MVPSLALKKKCLAYVCCNNGMRSKSLFLYTASNHLHHNCLFTIKIKSLNITFQLNCNFYVNYGKAPATTSSGKKLHSSINSIVTRNGERWATHKEMTAKKWAKTQGTLITEEEELWKCKLKDRWTQGSMCLILSALLPKMDQIFTKRFSIALKVKLLVAKITRWTQILKISEQGLAAAAAFQSSKWRALSLQWKEQKCI